ncbi:A1pp-domain-containing protein [Cadophora sp. DSE1049]|nr:A1pp-domain-containing protein [Cadophora sp. DSE1049]
MDEAPHSITSALAHRYPDGELDTFDQLTVMKMLLCMRSPSPPIPDDILTSIETVLQHERNQKLLTHSSTIPPLIAYQSPSSSAASSVKISVWKGDITTLSGVTAIVNAANSQMLGCFKPQHKCIDNAIHAAAGPRLRDECEIFMKAQRIEEPIGRAKVTKGYCLPAEHVIHTIGPQLDQGTKPSAVDINDLRRSYESCLDAAEQLKPMDDRRKILVFCCISTGIFAFPQALAANIAVNSAKKWIGAHPQTTITDIIFDVFLDTDLEIYSSLLATSDTVPIPTPPTSIPENSSLDTAVHWLSEADTLIISAGAGLSASTGLDYTSTSLFSTYLHGYKKYGFRRLYDLFGLINWPSEQVKWGYYFHHLLMIRNWPKSVVYSDLLKITQSFEKDRVHVRTSNADGFFVKNDFTENIMSTPQGRYEYLQCEKPCRKDAYFPSAPLLDGAIPFLDPVTQELTDASKVPKCTFCGRGLMLCVRSGSAFTEFPFREGEQRWKEFRRNVLGKTKGSTVILELGVGMSTVGVLRWPNEDLVRRSEGQVKLIRVGLENSGVVDWDMENAVGVKGDVGAFLKALKAPKAPSTNPQ